MQLPFHLPRGAIPILFSLAHDVCATWLHKRGNEHSSTSIVLGDPAITLEAVEGHDSQRSSRFPWRRARRLLIPSVSLTLFVTMLPIPFQYDSHLPFQFRKAPLEPGFFDRPQLQVHEWCQTGRDPRVQLALVDV